MNNKITTLFLLLLATLSHAQFYPELVKVTGGTFIMGDEWGMEESDEQPTHEVTLSDYHIGKTEVTVAQYWKYCSETGVSMPKEPRWGWDPSDPIVNVSWNDAINYCDWLSKKLDRNITLPTEAQWEFAARGGNQSKGYKYSGGRNIDTAGWDGDNGDSKAHAVARKKANELGLYDMSGNVYEWCLDWYDDDYYTNSPSKNPIGPSSGSTRVLRSGSFCTNAINCRIASRADNRPGFIYRCVGFRVVSF